MRYGYVGFIEKGYNELEVVDDALIPVVEALYAIPNVASYGVSCAGHIWDTPFAKNGALGIVLKPETRSGLEVLATINKVVGKYSRKAPEAFTFLKDRHLFLHDPEGETVIRDLSGRLIDYYSLEVNFTGCFKDKSDFQGLIDKKNRKSCCARLSQIENLWKDLASELSVVAEKYSFGIPDWDKKDLRLLSINREVQRR